jgi:glycosyltransferase involved in cell wall biosynthesis
MNSKTLKIIHILSSPSAGGAEVFVKDMVLKSMSNHIKPAIVFMSNAKEVGRDNDFEKKFISQLNAADISFVILPKGSRRNPIIGMKVFKKFVESFAPDCFHSHLLSGVIYASLFANKKALVHTHHSSIISSPTLIFKFLMRFCDNYIGISKNCAQFLNALIPKHRECNIIYNAIDIERVSTQLPNTLQKKDNVIIIAVGRISLVKNYTLLLSAINSAHKKIGNVFELKIAGEGSDDIVRELKDYVQNNDLTNIVTFLGNRTDIPIQLKQADIFVMSSSHEGLPIALLEAQIVGLPAIVTDVGGCKEVIDITEAGIVVPPHSEDQLSQAIIQLITNKEKRLLLANKALSNSRFFGVNECLKHHYKVYNNTIKS